MKLELSKLCIKKSYGALHFLHNLKNSKFLRRCEYIERKTPSKNIVEFLKHFSSRKYHKLFLGPPCSIFLIPLS